MDYGIVITRTVTVQDRNGTVNVKIVTVQDKNMHCAGEGKTSN